MGRIFSVCCLQDLLRTLSYVESGIWTSSLITRASCCVSACCQITALGGSSRGHLSWLMSNFQRGIYCQQLTLCTIINIKRKKKKILIHGYCLKSVSTGFITELSQVSECKCQICEPWWDTVAQIMSSLPQMHWQDEDMVLAQGCCREGGKVLLRQLGELDV